MLFFLILLLSSSESHAARPGTIEVSASILARSPESGAGEISVALPDTIAVDATGRRFLADDRGVINVRDAEGDLRVTLDSPFFEIRNGAGSAYEIRVPADAASRGTEVVFDSATAPLGARMCRAHLERARTAVLAHVPAQSVPRWFKRPVTCFIDYDEGCNAGWDGSQLVFHRGDSRCEPAANVADMMYHEYGHGVFDHLPKSGARLSSMLTEGVADTLATFITGDSRFAPGFWKGRQTTWLRDLSLGKVFPRDYAGTYTGALTYSTAWWELRKTLMRLAGNEAGARIAFRAFVRSIIDLPRETGPEPLVTAAASAIRAITTDTEGRSIPGLLCLAHRVFASHGLAQPPSDCPAITMQARQVAGPGLKLEITLVNAGAAMTDALRIRQRALSPLAPGERATFELGLAPATDARCGVPFDAELEVRDASGAFLAASKARVMPGAIAAPDELLVSLTEGRDAASLSIPDAPTKESLGPWRGLPYSVRLREDRRILEVSLESEVDHILPDDLIVGISAPRSFGETIEFFKGEEEIPVPRSISLPIGSYAPSGEIRVRDVANAITGRMVRASLRFQTVRVACPAP